MINLRDNSSRPKVCFVLPSLNGGGAERAAVHILNGLDPRRWDRSMYLFEREGPYLNDLDPGIALASADSASRTGRWHALRRYIAAQRPEIVVAFLSYFSVLSAARAANVRSVVVFNQQTPMSAFLTDADYHWRRRWRKAAFTAVARFAYAATNLVIATSRGVAADLTANFGVDPGKILVLANPVDLDKVQTASREPLDAAVQSRWQSPVVIAAGRLADAKNYPLLIEAMARLRHRVPASLVILGRGELETPLRALVAAKGLEGSVTFLGFQENPWKFIARADVFALSSRYEGFGNVLIEAMACGVPVVATASAGTRDIVTHSADGLLVESHTADALAAALERVLTDHAARARMGARATESAARFGLPNAVASYDKVLREAIAW